MVPATKLHGPMDVPIGQPGGDPTSALEAGAIQSMDDDITPSEQLTVDRVVGDVSVDDFDGLLLPGGAVNPDQLRADKAAVDFVGAFVRAGKPVAAICHAPWTLAEAGVLQGRTVTSFPSIRSDLRNAGATVVDTDVARDGNLITSRSPDDLPAFCAAAVELFAAA